MLGKRVLGRKSLRLKDPERRAFWGNKMLRLQYARLDSRLPSAGEFGDP